MKIEESVVKSERPAAQVVMIHWWRRQKLTRGKSMAGFRPRAPHCPV